MSMVQRQRTIRQKTTLSGVGLHTGEKIKVTLFPAGPNEGITFLRPAGKQLIEIPAHVSRVVDTRLATTLGGDGEILSTVEHFLGAMQGLGIDNLRVEVGGPEMPIMDGSASVWVDAIRDAGILHLNAQKKFWVVTKPVVVTQGDRSASLRPASHFSIHCKIDFNHPVISAQSYDWEFSDTSFHRDVARARTFGFLKDVEQLKAFGLGMGGSLDNAIVVDDFNILNPEGLRYPDEFVRHKLLDGLGDLALLGQPVIGRMTLVKGGHALHHMLVDKALKSGALALYEAPAEAAAHTFGEKILSLPSWTAPSEVFG